MDGLSPDKLFLFIVFVLPGFVSLKTYQTIFQSSSKGLPPQLLEVISYSCLNYAILFWPIEEVEASNLRGSYPHLYFGFYALVVFVAPVAWVCILMKVRNTAFVQKTLPHPVEKPWDYIFKQRIPYWIVITLKSGRTVGGRYDSKSFSSSAPAAEQIYLEEVWEINKRGGFVRAKVDSAGIIVSSSDIETMEFYELKYGGSDVSEAAEYQRGISTLTERLSTCPSS